MTMLLPVGSGIALILLMVHSWRVRGPRVTLGFFGAGLVFGLVRANVVWLIVSHLEGNPEAMKPYLPQGGFLPEIGHASIQVAMGWVFALYLAWTISELILRRLPPLADRVFVIVGPFNPHMLKPDSLAAYQKLKGQVAAWLQEQEIPHFVPDPLPSELYADASHPLAEGYRLLAQQLYAHEAFARFDGRHSNTTSEAPK